MAAVDGIWDDKTEAVVASIPVDVFGSGNHILYVNDRDSEELWGVTSASIVTTEADNVIIFFTSFSAYSPSP